MAITRDLLAAFLLLALALPVAPACAQDVFGGNGNDGAQQGRDVGVPSGNNSYYLRHLPPVRFGPAPPGRQPPPPINPNPCQPSGRGGYDWRNNPEGTPMPIDCLNYIAAERRAGRSGMPTREKNVRPIHQKIPDGLTDNERDRLNRKYTKLQETPGVEMGNDYARMRGYREVEFGNIKPNTGAQFPFQSNMGHSQTQTHNTRSGGFGVSHVGQGSARTLYTRKKPGTP